MASGSPPYLPFSVCVIVCRSQNHRLPTPSPTGSSPGVRRLLAAIDEILARRLPFLALFDARSCNLPSRAHIRLASEWGGENWAVLEEFLQGIGILLSSVLMRSSVNMLLGMAKPTQPHRVVTRQVRPLAIRIGSIGY